MIQPAATPPPPLVIYGAGGHGQVVAEAACEAGLTVLGFIDDEQPAGAIPVGGVLRILERHDERLDHARYHVAIGDNATREKIIARLKEEDKTLCNVIHPTAWVSPSATLGRGVFIGAKAVVNTAAELGDAVIVNSAAVVEHHCHLGDASHVGPGAVLAGRVVVGRRAMLGIGSRVLPELRIGEGCTLGAGAVLTRDAEAGQTLVGVPARER